MFVRDRRTGVTRRVSVGTGNRQANGNSFGAAISADGRFVAFMSDAPNLVPKDTNHAFDAFVRDTRTGVTRRVSVSTTGRQAASSSEFPEISADGRHVVFSSDASNLIAGDTNATVDVFVRNRQTGVTRRVPVGAHARQANNHSFEPIISANGRHVAFTSLATHLVPRDTNHHADVFVRDRSGDTPRFGLLAGPNAR